MNERTKFLNLNSGDTTESELCRVFSAYGNVKSTKIIVDRAGVSKGYGFVTFETEQEAQRLQSEVSDFFLFLTNYLTRNLKFITVNKNKKQKHVINVTNLSYSGRLVISSQVRDDDVSGKNSIFVVSFQFSFIFYFCFFRWL